MAAHDPAAGVTLRYDIEDSDPPVHIQRVIFEDNPDLTNPFYNGVISIQVGQNAGNWEVFDGVNYTGNLGLEVLKPGQEYPTPNEMGLVQTVKSIRRKVDEQTIVITA